MSRKILLAAMHLLKLRINLSLMHPADIDATIALLTVLRRYTFQFKENDVSHALRKLSYPKPTAKKVAEIARKINSGVTPHPNTKWSSWEEDIIDTLIAEAEDY